MQPRRLLLAAVVVAIVAPAAAKAVTLDEAIALAVKHAPSLQRASAEHDAAKARLQQARAGRMPAVTLQGSIAEAPTDFGGFFGFPAQTLTPRLAAVELRQPLFNGGRVEAGVAQAKAGEVGAGFAYDNARLDLGATVAEAFENVRVAGQALVLEHRQVDELTVVAEQAARRFQDGEVPRTDADQAEARLAGAKADLARAEGDVAIAAARYEALVGEAPVDLEATGAAPDAPANVNEAVEQAEAHNAGLAESQAALSGADEGVRRAKADRAPTLDLVVGASSVRDQFFPGYRSDSASVGVEGRWAIFTGGLVNGRINEAVAGRAAAQASLAETRADVQEAAIEAWQGLVTARAVATAAAAQSASAHAALASVREEVRVGEKPTLDLLDAEREALAAELGALRADAGTVVAAYRLKAAIGS